jgi:hypothetical protein
MGKILSLTLRHEGLKAFYPLFQQGVIIKTQVGCTIKDLLCRHLGITSQYLETRIQTLFLDGKAVDNPDKALVRDGATLALSGAMPGLVGATFRRGGTYASLRNSITFTESEEPIPQKDGQVVLKLFNLLVPELGPFLLAKGIWIKGADLDRFLKDLPSGLWETGPEEGKKEVLPYQISRSDLGSRYKDELILFKVSLIPPI